MEKFNTYSDQAIPLNIANVDTDQIIPARFLKATDKKGFGDNVFRDWRLIRQETRFQISLSITHYIQEAF